MRFFAIFLALALTVDYEPEPDWLALTWRYPLTSQPASQPTTEEALPVETRTWLTRPELELWQNRE